ncbi:MAG: type II toxin-antitoxin system RelE/ParE family toxin [Deinococcota bacterium]
MFEVDISPAATRDIKKLSKKYRADIAIILKYLHELEQFPSISSLVHLTNHEYEYRRRVGKFRIFFDVDKDARIIIVGRVERRSDHTY